MYVYINFWIYQKYPKSSTLIVFQLFWTDFLKFLFIYLLLYLFLAFRYEFDFNLKMRFYCKK